MDALPGFLKGRFGQADGTVDGVLCWDVFDYMDRKAAQALADQLNERKDGLIFRMYIVKEV